MMDTISLDLPYIEAKQSAPVITIVDASSLEDEANNPDNLVHHVLDANVSITDSSLTDHCLVCNGKLSVSGRRVMSIFSDEFKTSIRQVNIAEILRDVVNCNLKEDESHSTVICRKCFRLLDSIDCLEDQMNNLKEEVKRKFERTNVLVKADEKELPAYESVVEGDTIFKFSAKSRTKRRKRVRGRPANFVKLEVKEEADSRLNCFQITDMNDVSDSLNDMPLLPDHVENLLVSDESKDDREVEIEVKDAFEVDGLDLDNTENTIQIGGLVLPTISIDMAEQELAEKQYPLVLVENFNDSEGAAKYKCRFCQFQSNYFFKMKGHLTKNHADRLYECEVCNEKQESKNHLIQHLFDHVSSGWKPYTCHLCPKRYFLPRQFKVHLRYHLNKTITCYRCPRKFRSEAVFQEHMNSHTGYRPYSCSQCHKRFTGKHILKTHERIHNVRDRPHKCKICKKDFLNIHHYKDHMQIHKVRKDYICDTCGKAFSTQRSLDIHSSIHSGIKNFPCSVCQKAFARKGELEDHERTHTGEKPFQCEICGATFCQRSNLTTHKKATHFDEKRYQCGECPKAFKRKRLLIYHIMSVHTGERPYKCDFCGASFVYPEHYKKHLRIHSGEKPFTCEICGKKFNSRDNKNSHKFIHSDKKLYECLICGMGFMRKPHLLTHVEQHHTCPNPEDFIKVNPASIVDEELMGSKLIADNHLTVKIEEMNIDHNVTDHMLTESTNSNDADSDVLPRSIQIFDSDEIPRYIIQKSSDASKTDDNMTNFLASLQGQVVEVRPDDLDRYAELTTEHLSQVAASAGVVNQNSPVDPSAPFTSADSPEFRFFQIQIEDEKDHAPSAILNLSPTQLAGAHSQSKFDTPIILGGKQTLSSPLKKL